MDYQLQALEDLIHYRANQDSKWVTDKKWLYTDSGFSGMKNGISQKWELY